MLSVNSVAAYNGGVGYDLATGLGSVNASSLVSAWATAQTALTATTSTLTLNSGNPVSVTHGQPVSVSIGVTGAGGTPTGNVSLIAQTGSSASGQTGVQNYPLSSGSVLSSTTLLPGGSYNVFSHYAGDGVFGSSDSVPVPVTVNKENSRLQAGIVTFDPTTGAIISTNAASFVYGSPYILRMDILKSSGSCQPLQSGGATGGCAFDATGSVSVTDTFNGVTGPLDGGIFALNSEGSAEDQPIQLAAGSHSLSLSYPGDNSYNAASPSPAMLSLTVSKAVTTTSVASNPTTTTSGGSVTLTAVVNSNSNSTAGPSGTVQFLSNGSNLGAAVPCTPAGATATAGASCTATLATTLSTLPPAAFGRRPQVTPPAALLLLAALGALVCLVAALCKPLRKWGFVFAGFLLFVALTQGLAGCGGGGSGGGGGPSPHNVSITAKYNGDTNYAPSTAVATTVTVQ